MDLNLPKDEFTDAQLENFDKAAKERSIKVVEIYESLADEVKDVNKRHHEQ